MKKAIEQSLHLTLGDWPGIKILYIEKAQTIIARAQTVYPELTYPVIYLANDLGQHLDQALHDGKDAQTWLDRVLPEDFYLANACANHDTTALKHFERIYGDHLNALASRYANETLKTPDLLQTLKQKIIVGDHKRGPRLKSYSGQGALRSWLKITAIRHFMDSIRANKTHQPESLVEGDYFERIIDDANDLELDYLKTTYKKAFKTAFSLAVADLSPREKNILNQSMVGGLSIDKIGKMYQVHRATAARWINDARQSLIENTRSHMQEVLSIDEHELDSIMHMIQSRASVSLSRLLKPQAP